MGESKKLLQESGTVENRRAFQSTTTTVQTYTDEVHYKDFVIDLEVPNSLAIYKIIQDLEILNNVWRNGKPGVEEWEIPFEKSKSAFEQFKALKGH